MKKQLSNEEIAKVFAMYLGCQMECKGSRLTLTGVNNATNTYKELAYSYDLQRSIIDCKLLLRPLLEISDEDAINVGIIENEKKSIKIGFEKAGIQIGKDIVDKVWVIPKNADKIFQYLTSKGYDVPLFFGINHWANGKTATELGIAVSPTTSTP